MSKVLRAKWPTDRYVVPGADDEDKDLVIPQSGTLVQSDAKADEIVKNSKGKVIEVPREEVEAELEKDLGNNEDPNQASPKPNPALGPKTKDKGQPTG